MKKIEAVIRPVKLEELKAALHSMDVRGMSVYNVMGRGLQQDIKQYYRGQEVLLDLFPKIKVELICHDDQVDATVAKISEVCNTGKIGDGKIFIYPVEEIIRIRTGERGENAL
ncbi:MAG: P-II family nitrogen regulator [Syntrophomonas sp.]